MKVAILAVLAISPFLGIAQDSTSVANSQAIIERAKASTVIILAGEGAGRLKSIATGVVVSKEGGILTAFHAVEGAAEVQVRLASGEIYDHVQLLGIDERRDVAALKIPAGALPTLALGNSSKLVQGDQVFAVTNSNGLSWSATEGIISAIRPADEVPGAGTGFRLLQFTAPVASGASGGALVDQSGALIGIITGKKAEAAFAVPIESVLGLLDAGLRRNLGSGSLLQTPAQENAIVSRSSEAIAKASPKEILKNAKTIYVHSKTAFLTVDTLERALTQQKDWEKLGLTIVGDPRVADLMIEIDRPLFTYVHTFVISDKRTTIVLGTGKVTAFDGTIASGGLAKDMVKIFSEARLSTPSKK